MKKSMAKALVWLLVIIFNLTISVSPVLSFSIGEEREIGEKLLYSVRSTFKLIDDPDLTQYITRLGQSVIEVAGIQYFNYHFFIIDSKDFNAFAAPSGLIFFYSGLIGTMNSEDEMVSVVAHEIGHIVKRHLASRVEKSKYTTLASLGLAVAAIAFGGAATPVLLTGALATGQSMSLHFSREAEEEADRLAYGWMKKLKRNPEGQAKMLESMRRIARYRSDKLPQYLLTHPNPEARLNYIESLLDIDRDQFVHDRNPNDDFEFFRFKYRILSKVKDSQIFKNYLASVMADSRASEFKKIMAQYGLSQVQSNENNHSRSLALLDEVMKHFPDKNILKTDKGAIEFAAGKFKEAEDTLRKALQVDDADMYAAYTLALLLNKTGSSAEAQKLFRTVQYELPEYAKVYFELGKIASDNKQQGLSSFYLGKYNMYEGKLKLAEKSLRNALHDDTLQEETKAECKTLLKKVKKLK